MEMTMTNQRGRGTIRSGFETWRNEPTRVRSNEISHGAWWRIRGAYWHVCWIEDTSEVYAAELGRSDRFVFLGTFAKKDINALMRVWFDGDNLELLIQKCLQGIASDPA